MQIDKLQIELRPRSNAQALDLGFALLRAHPGAAYKAYLALWLPLIALCALLTLAFPDYAALFAFGAWWLKPLLERAPLYVLSRQVFGTSVTWREAVRAWPRQLGGGWFRLLTWGRLLAAGRGLQQPVWQLEMARGAVARTRARVLGRQGTFGSAFWFGIICFQLELVLQFGLIAFIGIFMGDEQTSNPVALFNAMADSESGALLLLAIYAAATAIIAPIYTACCFTLYLNRRASLEAWDLEIQLRQIARPVTAKSRTPVAGGAAALAALVLACSMAAPPDAHAAAPAIKCEPPASFRTFQRGPDQTPRQAQLRKQVDDLFQTPDLRGYECVEGWHFKKSNKPEKPDDKRKPFDFSLLASIFKALVIGAGIAAVLWLLYRYRHKFPAFGGAAPRLAPATEVGGLDIRAESLPDDVTGGVRALWHAGQRRAALALLYRATLSRLVTDDGLALTQGDTEGDCLRHAARAEREQGLSRARLQVATDTTGMWLDGAYAGRWPNTDQLFARCSQWDAQFGAGRSA